MVLERAAALARAVLERTRPLAPGQDSDATGGASSSTEDVARDAALHEVLLDPVAPTSVRRHAARALRLDPSAPLRAVALHDGEARVVSASETVSATVRAGIGPAVLALDLPASLIAARRALRFSAAGTMADPGPRTVHADEVQALLLLAETITPDTPPIPDVIALDRAAGTASWVLATLQALVTASTRRAAAAELGIHHSTLQERLSTAQHVLGWDLHDPAGQQRLHLALALRRLHRNPR